MELTQEKINANYARWMEKLKGYGAEIDSLCGDIGTKLSESSFSINRESGTAYPGSMIDVTMNVLCPIAIRVYDSLKDHYPFLSCDKSSIVRVCLLQHIAKAEMIVPETNEWRIKKGEIFTFSNSLSTVLKCGERSCYMCMKYGIGLTEEEYEAMRIIDKEEIKGNSFSSPLTTIIRMANQLTSINMYRKWKASAM